ncbi:hypothetical protein F5878DRAFT_548972 [Lentinula raphanica]|uniref:Uncharacterized protein n=1 Tax=Lentinula raphanica TaxID=153919 RepID=A0AA38NWF3_9AGAR|nr:hypothetical protein F5878DRAFT_548972 [Lentinula raphanica]
MVVSRSAPSSPHSSSARFSTRVVLLDDRARKLAEDSVSVKTRQRRFNDVVKFLDWAHAAGLTIPDVLPASENTLCNYAASLAGQIAGGTAKSKMASLKSWTVLEGHRWFGGERLKKVLAGVGRATPPSSFRAKRHPVLPKHLRSLHDQLSTQCGLDVCVAAAAKVMMYGQLCSGEVLPTNSDIHRYDSSSMPLARNLGPVNSSGSRCLFLPSTKTTHQRGDEVLIPVQNGRTDPVRALQDHFAINNVCDTDPLFSYLDSACIRRVLTVKVFLRRCNEIWKLYSYPVMSGHCFHIGGTTTCSCRFNA